MNIPCCSSIQCPGAGNLDYDTPIANLTSELPDQNIFIGLNFGWDFNLPPIGSNWTANSCLGVCTSTISQQDADLCAARANYACLIGSWGTPPGTFDNGGPNSGPPVIFPPPGNPPQTFTNQAQSCSALCPDGLPFTYTVGAGFFVARTQFQANQMAASYACQLAAANRICLGSLPSVVCQGVFFAQLLNPTGGLTPYTFSVSGGALPPGVTLDSSGSNAQIGGIPTVPGTYTFSILITDSRGNFMTKTYSLGVMGITSVALPDAAQGSAYSQQLTVSGGTAPYTFVLVSGSLPTGLTLSSSGLISGTPTNTGSFSFVVGITDSLSNACSQTLALNSGNSGCNASTDWNNPGGCRLRITGYFDGFFVNSGIPPCDTIAPGVGIPWDGTFPLFDSVNKIYRPNPYHQTLSGLSFNPANSFIAITFAHDPGGNWTANIDVNLLPAGVGALWRGFTPLPGSNALQVYSVDLPSCEIARPTFTLDGFIPSYKISGAFANYWTALTAGAICGGLTLPCPASGQPDWGGIFSNANDGSYSSFTNNNTTPTSMDGTAGTAALLPPGFPGNATTQWKLWVRCNCFGAPDVWVGFKAGPNQTEPDGTYNRSSGVDLRATATIIQNF